jgi:hypothetical protein
VRIRIEGRDLPGSSWQPEPGQPGVKQDIHVGMQRKGNRDDLLGVVPGDAPGASWTMDCVATPAPGGGADLRGPYIQGPPGGRTCWPRPRNKACSWDAWDSPMPRAARRAPRSARR